MNQLDECFVFVFVVFFVGAKRNALQAEELARMKREVAPTRRTLRFPSVPPTAPHFPCTTLLLTQGALPLPSIYSAVNSGHGCAHLRVLSVS